MSGTKTRRTAMAAALTGLVLSIALQQSTPAAADSPPSRFPNVTLTTHEGREVAFSDLIAGKIVAIDLIYTNCQYACPIETSRLARMQQLLGDRMGRDVVFISISIDPEHDTPEVLKAYAARFNAGPGWYFVTGGRADIDLLSKKLGLWSDPTESQDGHTPMLLVGNHATGQWMRTSALDNPAYTARIMTDWLTSWKAAQPGKSYADARPITTRRESGEYMFRSLCSGCHSIGQGEKVGPDLARALETRDRAWLAEYTRHPDVLRAKKDPVAAALSAQYREVRMPNLSLTVRDVESILGFIDETRASKPSLAAASPARHVAARKPGAPSRPHPVIDAALALHAALSRDTMAGVSGQAAALRDAATAAQLPRVATAAANLAERKGLAEARRAFGDLSDALVEYARAHAEVRASGVRVGYCPMLKRSWLQQEGPVANPYYGSRMRACGEFAD